MKKTLNESRRNTIDVSADAMYLTRAQAAAFLGLTINTLEQWACSGKGPAMLRLNGRTIRYSRADLIRYAENERIANSQPCIGCA